MIFDHRHAGEWMSPGACFAGLLTDSAFMRPRTGETRDAGERSDSPPQTCCGRVHDGGCPGPGRVAGDTLTR